MESNGEGLGGAANGVGSSATKMEISILTLKKEFLPKIAWRSAAAAALGTTNDPSPASLPPQQTDRHCDGTSTSSSLVYHDTDIHGEGDSTSIGIQEFSSLPPSHTLEGGPVVSDEYLSS